MEMHAFHEEICNAPLTKTFGGWCNVAVQRSHGSGETQIVALFLNWLDDASSSREESQYCMDQNTCSLV